MTSLPPLSPEMADLLESLCLEELSPADAARLEDLVCSDVQCCRQYIVFMEMHALAERFGAEGRGAGDQRRGMAGSPAIDGEEGFGVRGYGLGGAASVPSRGWGGS